MPELVIFPFPAGGAAMHITLENYLIETAAKNRDFVYLYFYENNDAIVLGKSLQLEQEIYVHKHCPAVYRRASGGGTVMHFYGSLNYGILLNFEVYKEFYPIKDSYEIFLSAIAQGFASNLHFLQKGISDISIWQNRDFKKISGNSQVRKRGWLIHHGTFIYDTKNLSKISYYLRPPPKQPEYRQKRSHKTFLAKIVPIRNRAQVQAGIMRGIIRYFSESHNVKKYSYHRNFIAHPYPKLDLPANELAHTGALFNART